MAKKIKATKASKKALTHQEMVVELERLAEENGMRAKDLLEFPYKFKGSKLKPELITPALCVEAEHYHVEKWEESIRKWNAEGKQVWVWDGHPEFSREKLLGINQTIQEELPAHESDRAPAPTVKGARQSLFGFPVTHVLRWMGKDDWTMQEATVAMQRLGMDVAKATISAQLLAGRKGQRGEPANLTQDQIKQLYSTIKDM